MKMGECKNCRFKKGDCGHHFSMNGEINYNIPSAAACGKQGYCMFFEPEQSSLSIEKAMKLMKIEKECVLRQDTDKCNRDECGCQCCDLVQDPDEIVEAYDVAIDCMKFAQTMINTIVESMKNTGCETIEEFQMFLKAGDPDDK